MGFVRRTNQSVRFTPRPERSLLNPALGDTGIEEVSCILPRDFSFSGDFLKPSSGNPRIEVQELHQFFTVRYGVRRICLALPKGTVLVTQCQARKSGES